MRAISVTTPGRLEVVDVPCPEPGPYQALLKTEVACLCNSTDGKLVAGHFPGVNRYPLLLGHESAGIVERIGDRVRSFKVGDRVIGGLVFDCGDPRYASGWGGFCEYTLANDHDAMVADHKADADAGWYEVYEIQRPVAPDIPVEAAALLCTWREVYGGFGDFNLKIDDDILVYGGGPVGLSFVKFARLLGLGFVGLVDPIASKRERALRLGATAVFAPDSAELAALAAQRGKPLDAVIDAVGSPKIVNAALALVRLGGSVCVYGVIADAAFTLEKGKGPYNFNLYVHQWPTRFRERAAQGPICDWLRSGKLAAEDFVTHRFPMEKIGEAFETVKAGSAIKVVLEY